VLVERSRLSAQRRFFLNVCRLKQVLGRLQSSARFVTFVFLASSKSSTLNKATTWFAIWVEDTSSSQVGKVASLLL
jgi:hypothetical protein